MTEKNKNKKNGMPLKNLNEENEIKKILWIVTRPAAELVSRTLYCEQNQFDAKDVKKTNE